MRASKAWSASLTPRAAVSVLGLGGLSAGRDDHVDLETDELGREIAEPLQAPVREPFLDHDRLADDVAEIAEPPLRNASS